MLLDARINISLIDVFFPDRYICVQQVAFRIIEQRKKTNVVHECEEKLTMRREIYRISGKDVGKIAQC